MKMSTLKYIAIAAAALVLAAGCKTTGLQESPKTAAVDQLFAKWDRADSPGAAVVVVKDGAVVYQRGYGSANLESRTAITPQTAFDAASVAKQFTGLAIAMLIEQGKLSLDDDIRKHIPDVPDFGKPITIRHLLYHTSGLRDWPETLGLSGMDWGAVITMDTILEMVRRQQELDFMPGEEQQYCNTSYNLLAATVSKVTGKSFRAWTDANIFEPLGMKQTHFCENPAKLIPNRAESYSAAGNNKYNRTISQLAAQGSSSLFITAEDMGKWLVNFQKEAVGGRSAFERMYEPGKLNNGKKIDYGFGVVLGNYHGDRAISHGGGWAGYRSVVVHIPEKNFGVAILGNAGDLDTTKLARQIADVYFGHSSAPKKPVESPTQSAAKLDPSIWEAYTGTYRLGAGWLLEIARDGDQLTAQATREDKVKMTAVSDTKFFVAAYNAPVEFVPAKSGPATHLLYRGIRAPRLQVPKLSPTGLQPYVGDYWSEELRVAYRVELRDGDLGVRDRSGKWFRLLPTGADRFDVDQQRTSVEFIRNAASEVMELKVSGGRIRNVRFSRGLLPQPAKQTKETVSK
jgi:CubicO group peptidase (beta-lactamase class C family)